MRSKIGRRRGFAGEIGREEKERYKGGQRTKWGVEISKRERRKREDRNITWWRWRWVIWWWVSHVCACKSEGGVTEKKLEILKG